MYFLAGPLAFLIRPIYEAIQNYGWTLVIVTVLINLLTIPLTVISQKSTSKTQQLQPLLMELQKKYKNDKEKYSAEMQKLYTKYNINPMAGCFPMIIRILIIFGFIGVIYNPLQYILQLTAEQIQTVTDAVRNVATAAGIELGARDLVYQVKVCGMAGAREAIEALGIEPINFNFLGIDLTKMLKENMGDFRVWIIPALAVLATVASSFVTKKIMARSNAAAGDQAAAMNNSMIMIMPIMTAYFTFIMPVGMSLYWLTSTLVNMAQQIVVSYIMKKHPSELPLTEKDSKRFKKLEESKKNIK